MSNNVELKKKLISDSDRVEQLLKRFPNNVCGGNKAIGAAEDTLNSYNDLMEFVGGKCEESSFRVNEATTKWLEENEINLYSFSQFLGVDSTILKRAGYISRKAQRNGGDTTSRKKNNATWLPYNYAEQFSHYVAKMSCHELYFGFEGMTLLPRRFSALVELVKKSSCSDEIRSQFFTILKSTYNVKSENYYKKDEDPNFKNKSIDFCKARLDEICADRYVPSDSVIKNVPSFMKSRLDGLFTDKKMKPKTITVLSISLMIGTSVDYFTAIDYLLRTRAYYYTPGGERYVVTMKDHKWLQILVTLPDEIQNRVMKELYAVVLPTVSIEE